MEFTATANGRPIAAPPPGELGDGRALGQQSGFLGQTLRVELRAGQEIRQAIIQALVECGGSPRADALHLFGYVRYVTIVLHHFGGDLSGDVRVGPKPSH